MKIELLLKHIIGKEVEPKTNKKVYLKIKIGDDIQFNSGDVMAQNKTYSFLQTNYIQVDDQLIDYISFQLIQKQQRVAQKTIFIQEALNNNTVDLHPMNEKQSFKLQYHLEITNDEEVMMPKMKRKTTIKDQPEHMSNDEGKLQILKMGVLMYNFSQRLDPTLKVYRLMKSIFKWEKPFLTVLFGCSLSFMVLYPKLSILFLSLFLVFGRHMILKKLEEFQVQQDVSKRILLPEENVVFLQNNMEKYCELFESVNTFLRDEDRTQLINIVRLLTKLGFLLILLELIFPLQALLLGLIWTMLVVFSPFRDKIFDIFMPKILLVNDYIDKFTFKIHESKLGKIISFNEIRKYTIIKQLYIYEYQRWWVGKQWVSSHWSDQNRQLVLLARKQPPKNWKWIQAWKTDYQENKDEEGFEYSNDLLIKYTPSKSLKTIRRRKWIRKCVQSVDKFCKKPKSKILETSVSKIQ